LARRRIRGEEGIGLIELVLAMTILSIALLVMVASFSSAATVMRRASAQSTAGAIADSRMEIYRSMTWDWIGLDTSLATDSVYQADVTCTGGTSCSDIAPSSGDAACQSGGTVYAAYASAPQNPCAPTISPYVGPDHRNYRVDVYIQSIQTVSSGNPRSTKLVTVVVRDSSNHVLAREESDFDYCDGLADPSGLGETC